MDQTLLRLPNRTPLPLLAPSRPSSHSRPPTKPQAGYRDGITAGKEGALQEGFDAGFAQAGAPRGHELGLLRGLASALLLHLSRTQIQTQAQTQTQTHTEKQGQEQAKAKAAAAVHVLREIVDALAVVRFTDIAPPPPREEADHLHMHMHLHGADAGEREEGEEEDEEGQWSSTGLGPSAHSTSKTTIEDVRALRVKLETLLREAGLKVDLNLESIP